MNDFVFARLQCGGKNEKKVVKHKLAFRAVYPQFQQADSILHNIDDPQGLPKITAGKDNSFRTCCPSICLYVHPHYSNLEKQNNRKQCSLLA